MNIALKPRALEKRVYCLMSKALITLVISPVFEKVKYLSVY